MQILITLEHQDAETLYSILSDPDIPEDSRAGIVAFMVRKQIDQEFWSMANDA